MSKVEVLVATMNQNDLSLFEKMNIQTDVIFCNQCDKNEYIETEINGCRVRMLSTTTKGISINRNLAMQLSNAEYCLFSDDDVRYVDGYEKIIIEEFKTLGMPDFIGFSMTTTGNFHSNIIGGKTKKMSRLFGSVGSPQIVYFNKSIKYNRISFNVAFGSGSSYSNGEETLFCKDLIRNHLKMYLSNKIIGNIHFGESTWFKGYTDKFFFDKGAWCKAAYPIMWLILKYYLVIVYRSKGEQSILKKIELMNNGAKAYKLKLDYQEYNEKYKR